MGRRHIPLWKALISLAKKGVFRFAKMAGIGGGTRPAISKRLEFPENRENNREFSKFPAISALFAGFRHWFSTQFQCVADDSLFCTETANLLRGTGNSSVGAGNCSTLIPMAFRLSSDFSLYLLVVVYTTKVRIRRVCYFVLS